MAACGKFAYQSKDDTTLVTEDQAVIKCRCGRVNVELCKPKPLSAAVCVCNDCWNARKYSIDQDKYDGDEKTVDESVRTQNYVYFGNELKILKGDDNVQFAVLKKHKDKNDWVRMYAKCCYTIMLGYSREFHGWKSKNDKESRRIAYLYNEKLYQNAKSYPDVPKPTCILWKNDMSVKKRKPLEKKLGLQDKTVFTVGHVNPKGDRKQDSKWKRYCVTTKVCEMSGKPLDAPVSTGNGSVTFLDLMKAQMEDGPEEWDMSTIKKKK